VARGRIARLVCAASVLAASGCVGGDTGARAPPGDAELRGGTLRVALFDVVERLDPLSNSGPGAGTELYRCCLLRTLVSYAGVPTAEGGGILRPDLAERMPTVSRDGLAWTFTLRRGLRYAPPHADTAITSGDVARALERLGRSGSYYSHFFHVIAGFADFAAGRSDSISGLEQPDGSTLRVRLTEPAGDLGDLFALPVTAPIPAAARGWRTKAGYGPDVAVSGPYMVEPASDGRKPRWREGGPPVRLVRNPSWRPSSDLLRPAYADRIDLFVVRNDPEVLAPRVDAGELDIGEATAAQIKRYRARPQLRSRLHYNEIDGMAVLYMNVAQPPFDDVHVRRAMNLAVDRVAIGAGARTATHLVTNGLERDLLASYDPYGVREGPRIAAARDQMAQSRYDTDGDGRCDARVCRRVGFPITSDVPAELSEPVTAAAHAIGVELDTRVLPFDRWAEAIAPEGHAPLVVSGWFKDYHNPSTFFVQFHGAYVGGGNLSLVGATRRKLARLGYDRRSVPSVDAKLDQCVPLVGADQATCWAEADKLLMEGVVAAVPLVFWGGWVAVSPRVARYSWDQSVNAPALDRIVLVEEER
jgi:ABC-type transport system substrate-binding protein